MNAPSIYYSAPPENCDVCDADLDLEFFDAAITIPHRLGRTWANVCPECFKRGHGMLGTGRGQQYQRQPDGRWLKISG